MTAYEEAVGLLAPMTLLEKDAKNLLNRVEDEVLKAQRTVLREKVEALKTGQKIDIGHDCYEKDCEYCDNGIRNEALDKVLELLQEEKE